MDIFDTNETLNISKYNCHHYTINKDTGMTAAKILMIMTIIFMILLGLAGNLLMCFALCSTSHLRTITNIFTVNLGITDLGIVCFVMPMWIVGIAQEHHFIAYEVPFGISLCKFTSFLTLTLVFVSAATLACISLDRYICICHPLKYPRKVTVVRVFVALIYIWLQGILLASTPLYGWGCFTFRPMSIAICNNLWVYSASYSVICFVLGLVIPFLIMMVSYICIFRVARMQARRIQAFTMELVNPWAPDEAHKSQSCVNSIGGQDMNTVSAHKVLTHSQQKTTTFTSISKSLKTLQTAFIVVGIFVVCWVPYVTIQFWSANYRLHQVASGIEFMCTLVAFSNSSVNPLIFMFLTRDLRLKIKDFYKRFKTFMAIKKNVVGVAETQRAQIRWPLLGQEASVQVIHLQERLQMASISYFSSEDDEEEDHAHGETPKISKALFSVGQLFGALNRRDTLNSDPKKDNIVVESDSIKRISYSFRKKIQQPVFSAAVKNESESQTNPCRGKPNKLSLEP